MRFAVSDAALEFKYQNALIILKLDYTVDNFYGGKTPLSRHEFLHMHYNNLKIYSSFCAGCIS